MPNIYQKYIAAGLGVIPAQGGIPSIKWGQYQNTLPSLDDAAAWHGDVVLVCGAVAGVIALDIDTDNAELIKRIEAMAGVSSCKKKGSKGFTSFFKYQGEASKQWKVDGVVVLEILSEKRLTTIPPSKHRVTGKPYEWVDGVELIGTPLPVLPPDFIAIMDAMFPAPAREHQPSYPRHDYGDESIELQQAEEMLRYISPDCARDEWVQIGMALRSEFGDVACGLWHDWSCKSAKYKTQDAQSAWRSFNGSGVTIGTLVFMARQSGFLFESETRTPAPATAAPATAKEKKAPATAAPLRAHGLVGEIADWITSTAIIPQPVLSLAAAITFMGLVKGHRVKGGIRGSCSNLLVLSLAPTGGGKEHPQLAVDNLAMACGLGHHLMGRPVSGTGLLTGLEKADCLGLLAVDEMGRYIGNIALKNANGTQREIIDYMVELFSKANGTFRGRQYANEKERPQQILQNPHFCCIGSTVPEKLKAACTSSEVIDGFLNRWLLFSTTDRPDATLGKKDFTPPTALVEKIKAWMFENPINRDAYGNLTQREVEFTPEGWEKIKAYQAETTKKIKTEPYPFNELYVRSTEHATKLALVLADDEWIGIHDVNLAIRIVEESNKNIAVFAASITDSGHHENVLYVLDEIKRAGKEGIQRSVLTRRSQKLNERERGDILRQLMEAEDIITKKDGKKITFFAA